MADLLMTPDEMLIELEFLKSNPQFEQRPATIMEFLGPKYLNIEDRVRDGLKQALLGIFGDTVSPNVISKARRAMITGGIGIGKTTIASIIIPYMVHWVWCLKNPQNHFGLLPGSRIAFMQMSTTENQAKEVMFGDIKARIENSPWFRSNCQYDKDFKNQLRFEAKDIWVLPGNSAETSFEGYNILGGILDEGDSHKTTQDKDFAELGYDTIHSRIDSRFMDPVTGQHRGLIVVIGQMKKESGFMAKKKAELEKDEHAVVVTMAIWESLGWDKFLDENGDRKSFFYDIARKEIVPKLAVDLLGDENLIEIPEAYKTNFLTSPEKALRDLAGIPPATNSPFISLTHKIDECTDRWEAIHGKFSPVTIDPASPRLIDDFRSNSPAKRTIHLDIAVSGDGDALGMAMGHVSHLVEIEDELKPFIMIDFLFRMRAVSGTEIILGDIRRVIYNLVDERDFKIAKVTMDGFQSTDTRQQLNRRRISSEYLSVDRTLTPYHDLREAIYEERIAWPRYITYLNRGSTDRVEILNRELRQLSDKGDKIDHPAKGSKDVADAVAGVTHTLLGDRQYRRVARVARDGYGETTETPQEHSPDFRVGTPAPGRHSDLLAGLQGLSAPIPPTSNDGSFPAFPAWRQ